jgi:hypothetical protein
MPPHPLDLFESYIAAGVSIRAAQRTEALARPNSASAAFPHRLAEFLHHGAISFDAGSGL